MKIVKALFLLSTLAALCSCGQHPHHHYMALESVKHSNTAAIGTTAVKPQAKAHTKSREQVGVASWYGPRFHGRKTASGLKYNQHEYTAAHPDLPLFSLAKVVNLENNRSILVLITDRGPYVEPAKNRIIDLSRRAARDLGMLSNGLAKVKVEYLHDHTAEFLSRFKGGSNTSLSQAMLKHVTYMNAKNAGA